MESYAFISRDWSRYIFIIFLIDRNMHDFRLYSLNRNFYSDFPGVSLYLQCTVFIVFINEKPDEFRNFSENSIRWRLIFILQTNLSQYYIRSLHVEYLNEILFSLFGNYAIASRWNYCHNYWNFPEISISWFSRKNIKDIRLFLMITFLFSLKTNIILNRSKYLTINWNF